MRLAKVLVALALLTASTLGVLAGPPALAANGTQSQIINAPPDATGNRFGFAADVNEDNGTVALVGAPGTNPPTPGNVGKAFVFTHQGDTWPLQQELVPAPSTPQDFFGGAVALSGNGHTALVGAPGNAFASSNVMPMDSVLPGAAFIFTQDGVNGQWTQQAMLTGSGMPNDVFGFAVALSRDGHTAVVGASNEETNKGAVYVFTEQEDNTWALQARLADPGNSPQSPTPGDNFGFAVAMNPEGHEILIGADQAGNFPAPPADGAGFADIYVQNDDGTWPATPTQQLTPSDGALFDGFGDAVALNGDGHVALIGSEGHNGGQGSAYVFATHGGTWSQQQEVSGSSSDGAFGYAVAIDGNADTAKISAPFTNDGANAPAYRFTGKVGTWSTSLVQMEPGPTDYGSAVALNHEGNVELVGADDDLPDAGNGVVYAYEF